MKIILFKLESKWVEEAFTLAKQFADGSVDKSTAKEQFINWHTNVKLVFLGYLSDRLELVTEDVYSNLRDILGLHDDHFNAEVKHVWYPIALKTNHGDVVESVKKFLLGQGRMKYVRPVMYAWFAFDKTATMEFFNTNKGIYHQVAVRLMQKKLEEMK